MWARRVGVEGAPVGGWSSAPPPVIAQQQGRADAKVRVIAAIIIDVIVFGIVYPMDMPRANPKDAVCQCLTYLADADAESALGMQTMTLSDREERFLTNGMLCASDSRIVIESVEGKTGRWRVGEFTRVEATMSVNDERATHGFFAYHRKPAKDSLAEWYLSDGLLVCMAATGNGVPGLPVRGDSAGVELLPKSWQECYFFPGVYTLTPEGRSDGGTVDSQTVVVVGGSGTAAAENTTVRFQCSPIACVARASNIWRP